MFGKRLKILRKENKLYQNDLAKLHKVSASTIGMYEQGKRDPDTQTIIFFANYFNVTTDWILGVSDIRNPYCMNNFNLDLSTLSKEDIIKVEEYVELLKLKNEKNKRSNSIDL